MTDELRANIDKFINTPGFSGLIHTKNGNTIVVLSSDDGIHWMRVIFLQNDTPETIEYRRDRINYFINSLL